MFPSIVVKSWPPGIFVSSRSLPARFAEWSATFSLAEGRHVEWHDGHAYSRILRSVNFTRPASSILAI